MAGGALRVRESHWTSSRADGGYGGYVSTGGQLRNDAQDISDSGRIKRIDGRSAEAGSKKMEEEEALKTRGRKPRRRPAVPKVRCVTMPTENNKGLRLRSIQRAQTFGSRTTYPKVPRKKTHNEQGRLVRCSRGRYIGHETTTLRREPFAQIIDRLANEYRENKTGNGLCGCRVSQDLTCGWCSGTGESSFPC